MRILQIKILIATLLLRLRWLSFSIAREAAAEELRNAVKVVLLQTPDHCTLYKDTAITRSSSHLNNKNIIN